MKPILCTLLLLTSPLHAQSWSSSELHHLKQKEALAASFFSPEMKEQQLNAFLKAKHYKDMAKQLSEQANSTFTAKQGKPPQPLVMILASLGMPEASLKQLLKQSEQYHVPLVIRGLYKHDFQKTVFKIQSLVAPKEGKPILSGFEINPTVFKKFSVNQVPAFVVVKEGACQSKAPCNPNDFDVVFGNVSLPNALELISTKGQHRAIAKRYLK